MTMTYWEVLQWVKPIFDNLTDVNISKTQVSKLIDELKSRSNELKWELANTLKPQRQQEFLLIRQAIDSCKVEAEVLNSKLTGDDSEYQIFIQIKTLNEARNQYYDVDGNITSAQFEVIRTQITQVHNELELISDLINELVSIDWSKYTHESGYDPKSDDAKVDPSVLDSIQPYNFKAPIDSIATALRYVAQSFEFIPDNFRTLRVDQVINYKQSIQSQAQSYRGPKIDPILINELFFSYAANLKVGKQHTIERVARASLFVSDLNEDYTAFSIDACYVHKSSKGNPVAVYEVAIDNITNLPQLVIYVVNKSENYARVFEFMAGKTLNQLYHQSKQLSHVFQASGRNNGCHNLQIDHSFPAKLLIKMGVSLKSILEFMRLVDVYDINSTRLTRAVDRDVNLRHMILWKQKINDSQKSQIIVNGLELLRIYYEVEKLLYQQAISDKIVNHYQLVTSNSISLEHHFGLPRIIE
jgi:hypothetical protein